MVDVSLSRSQYPVNESEGRVIVQVLKNKKIANPLSLGVSTWTLGEAESKGCLPLIDFQVDTGKNFPEVKYASCCITILTSFSVSLWLKVYYPFMISSIL